MTIAMVPCDTNLPVAVATSLLNVAIAVFCTLSTLFSALAMVLIRAVWALNALANAALLTAAWLAASPDRVCDALSAEIFERAEEAAAALARLAAAAIEAACLVASWAHAMALRPAKRKRESFIVISEMWIQANVVLVEQSAPIN